MSKRKVLIVFLSMILVLTSSVGVYAKSPEKNKDSKVYFINENGELESSNINMDFFITLSKEGNVLTSEPDIININTIPIDGSAIRITDSIYRSITNENYNVVIDIAIGTLFSVSWAKFAGLLRNMGTGALITENTWTGSLASASIATAISRATDWVHVDPTYIEFYQYKQWSDYWNAYLIYDVMIRYSDPNFQYVEDVTYWNSGMQSVGMY